MGSSGNLTIRKRGKGVEIVSYRTVIGFVDEDLVSYWDTRHYSVTTSMHMSNARSIMPDGASYSHDVFMSLLDEFQKDNVEIGEPYQIPKFGRLKESKIIQACMACDLPFPSQYL
jgi:hypothetical protein